MYPSKNYVEDHWLGAYAAGQLPVGLSLMIASHVDMCPELSPKLLHFETVGAALLEDFEDGPKVSQDMLTDLLNRIEVQEASFPDLHDQEAENELGNKQELFPLPVQQFLGHGFDQARWRFAGPGSVISHLWQDENQGRLWMFRSKGGTVTLIAELNGPSFYKVDIPRKKVTSGKATSIRLMKRTNISPLWMKAKIAYVLSLRKAQQYTLNSCPK